MGNRPTVIMLGLMGITAVLSMFMSNTATTAMVLSILMPILAQMPEGDGGRTALALSIPLAANVGGLGTPIGTPPNAIVLEYIPDNYNLDFSTWMAFGVPLTLILLLFGWYLLRTLYPFQAETLELDLKGKFQKSPKAWVVYITFIVTILLWLTDFLHGMNTYVVAVIPLAVFLATNVLNKEDLKLLSWDVLWLVAGGIALGLALEGSGLAVHVVETIPFGSFPILVVLVSLSLLAVLMANFMSNTATANLLLPLVAALGTTLSGLEVIGGPVAFLVAVTLSCSLGMALPISTPPNALAHATGTIKTSQMTQVGLIMAVFGFGIIMGLIFLLKQIQFFG
jgi:sodium-dependent dicarboxylate transporter 2/3/5